MDNLGFLFAANAFVWGGVIFYLVSLKKRNHALERDVELLKNILDKGSKE